jgi:tetratricopeptide (TPR) repeat protein
VVSFASIATNLGHPEEAFGWLNGVDRGIRNGAIERSLATESDLAHCFATIYANLGQHNRALPYAERSVRLYERCENEGNTSAKLTAKAAVANIYSNLGQRDKALAIYKESYKEARKEWGSSHPTTKSTKKNWPTRKIIGQV